VFKNNSAKVGRNDPCPCGSGKKYKKCCLNKQGPTRADQAATYMKKYGIKLKGPNDAAGIRECGKLVIETLDRVEEMIRPGLVTEEINAFVDEFTRKRGAVPAPLNYNGFPKSVCVSVNEVICHGIPGDWELNEGDIVNVDVTSILDGYFADANKTFFVGKVSEEAERITGVARESLRLGLEQVGPGNRIGDIGHAIQTYAEGLGCSVVREMQGHGVGFKFHEAPGVPHYGKAGKGVPMVPGMVFTIEPMINLGGHHMRILDDKWTVVTLDGSLSAQFEQTVLVTENGREVLTPYPL
jgi:methionyl aminopeptidase